MEFDRSRKMFARDDTAYLDEYLQSHAEEIGLGEDAIAYFGFPLYKGDDDDVLVAEVLIASPDHGVFVIACTEGTSEKAVSERVADLDDVYSHVYAKLLRSRELRATKNTLIFDVHAIVFAHNLPTDVFVDDDAEIIRSRAKIGEFVRDTARSRPLTHEQYGELRAVIEGAKGLIRPKKRDLDQLEEASKGQQAHRIEQEIIRFDSEQRRAAIRTVEGPQRIRGLAGSGKTVVLAMKAALLHLRYPNAKVLYTFYTKSLYQHIQRLVTRFYRQFADQDPEWENLHLMHAWGGSVPGVYSETARRHGVAAIKFQEAAARSSDPFDYVIRNLVSSVEIVPVYDYVLVDEGQDYPLSFLRLAAKLARNERCVFAADELQTIFQTQLPGAKEILGDGRSFTEDIVLHKCYRNPREVLVSAHALGFGLYGARIVQMLEDKEHWEVIGYQVESDFVEGEEARILRPEANSLESVSGFSKFEEIIQVSVHANMRDEVEAVAKSIGEVLKDGLRPDDVLVVCVDDRNAKAYFNSLGQELFGLGVSFNNVHAAMGLVDFQREDHVTFSTVHKAKGNEAFMVYVLGVDALLNEPVTKRSRNMLFTAITRAKGWVRISGCEDGARTCSRELAQARKNFPYLVFKYPSEKTLDLIRRDREDEETVKVEIAKRIESGDFGDEEMEYLRELLARSSSKKKVPDPKPRRTRKGR